MKAQSSSYLDPLSHFSLLLSDSLPRLCTVSVRVRVWLIWFVENRKTDANIFKWNSWYMIFFHLIFSIFCLIEESFCRSVFKMQARTAVILGLLSDKWAVFHCCFSNWYPAFKWITCIISLFSLNSEILLYFPSLSLMAVFWGICTNIAVCWIQTAYHDNFPATLFFHVEHNGYVISPECCSPPGHWNSNQAWVTATLCVRCTFLSFAHQGVHACTHQLHA